MNARQLRDISIALRPGTPEWPGDTAYGCGWTWEIARGDSVNVSAITLSPHVGTHADAPLHVRDGWPASEAIAADAFLGEAYVIDARGVEDGGEVDDALVEAAIARGARRLLVRTGRTIADGRFPEGWPVLAEATAKRMAGAGVRLVGIDAPSMDARASKTLPVHHALLGAGVAVVENLDLRDVAAGVWELIALPIRVEGLDAAPVRAMLARPAGAA